MSEYQYKLSITGEIFYYRKGKLVAWEDIPKKFRPEISKEDLRKAATRKQISRGLLETDASGERASDVEAEPLPTSGRDKTPLKGREVYYTEVEGEKHYLVVKLIGGNKELLKIDAKTLKKHEILSARSAEDFYTENGASIIQSPPRNLKGRRKRATIAEGTADGAGGAGTISTTVTDLPQVYVGKTNGRTYYWIAKQNSLGDIYAERVARTKLAPEQIRSALPREQLDEMIGLQRKWQDEDCLMLSSWGRWEEHEPVSGVDPQHDPQHEEMRSLLDSQNISSIADWRRWALSSGTPKSADLVERVNSAVKELFH